MSRARSLLSLSLALSCWAPQATVWAADGARAPRNEIRLLFVGDILLSRQVRTELEATRQSPWRDFQDLFRDADWVGGNLEGAVGAEADCIPSPTGSPCFAIPPASLALLREAGFRGLSVENNHASDLGPEGREATRLSLIREGLHPLRFEDSPIFLRFGDLTVGLVAFSSVAGGDGRRMGIPSVELRQKLRLARRLANLVVVSVHWGSELLDWPSEEQRRQAEWLVRQGADIIFGHHPHVVQQPACVLGRPVFYSLGNHLFDQRYPATKEGLIADCRVSNGKAHCGALSTNTPASGSFPRLAGRDSLADTALANCACEVRQGLSIGGYTLRPQAAAAEDAPGGTVLEAVRDARVTWHTRPTKLVSLDVGRLAGVGASEMVFTLKRHYSSLDEEEGLRPYVYEVGPGGLIAKWRGSALAWPLLDAALLPGSDGILCALHRGDSFIQLDPESGETRVAAYRWNGFGFSGVEDKSITARCRVFFGRGR